MNNGEKQLLSPRERQLAGLRPRWKPGQSGNPAGRPKKQICITTLTAEYLLTIPESLPDGIPNTKKKTWAQLTAEKLVHQAVGGDTPAMRELLDRIDGKVKAQSEHSGDGFKLILGVKPPPIQIVKFADIQDRLGQGR